MADPQSGNDLPRGANLGTATRRRYILRATIGYALFAALWILLSDRLLDNLVDVRAIEWLSTIKGLFFVVVTTLLLFVGLRGVPDHAAAAPAVPQIGTLLAIPSKARPWLYLFAVLASIAMLLVRSGMAVSFSQRPLLILYMFPIILAATAGGLGPGLVATVVSAICTAPTLSPAHIFLPVQPHDLFQWTFLLANGVLVSVLAEVLHRSRRQSEASRQLQAVTLTSIGDGVITTDTRGIITFLNPEAERLTGWSCQEAKGESLATVFRVINEGNRQPVEDPVHKVLTTGEVVGIANHTLLIRRDGVEVPVVDSGAPIRLDDNTLLGVVLVFRDDTNRRQAEMVLQQERGFLKTIIRTLPDLVWLKDPEGVYLACNGRFERCFGASEAEIVGKTDYDFVDRELGDFFRQKDREAIAKGGPSVNREEITYADDGHRELLETIKTPMFDGQGKLIGVLGLARDITASCQAEEALRQSEATYRSLFENMLNGFAYCRMLFEEGTPRDFIYLNVNHAFEALTGLKDVEGRRVSEVIPGIREADPDLFAIYGRVAMGGPPERFEIFVEALGMWFAISVYSPKPDHFVAIFDVITERKKAEKALQESERRFRDIAEISADWIWEVDSEGRYTYASQSVHEMLGYRAEEIIGKTPFDLMPPGEAVRLATEFGAIVARREPFRDLDNLNRHRDGSLRYVQSNGKPILDAQDNLLGYRGVDRDVTAQRETELRLRQSLAEKVALLKEVHHRVKNNLQIMASLLNLQAKQTANAEAVAALLDTRNRVHSMALLHEVLYRSDNLAQINLVLYVKALCTQLLRAFGQAAERVQVEQHIGPISLPLDQAVPCGLIINELVTNAFKYGFPDARSGRVMVEIELRQGRLELSVRDNGVGLPAGLEPAAASTLGLQLVTMLTGQLNGQLRWENPAEGGALFRVSIPAPAAIQQGGRP